MKLNKHIINQILFFTPAHISTYFTSINPNVLINMKYASIYLSIYPANRKRYRNVFVWLNVGFVGT